MLNILKAIRTRRKVIREIFCHEARNTQINYILSMKEPQPGFELLKRESIENESKINLLKSLL